MTATAEETTAAAPEAPAAEAITAAAGPAAPRVGVHGGAGAPVHAHAPVHARAGARAQAHAKKWILPAATLWGHFTASLRRDKHHGAPWEEHPMSLVDLRASLHHRAAQHEALPFFKPAYLAWCYLVILPASVAGYAALWVLQGPPRTAVAVALIVTLHYWHPLAAPALIQNLPFAGFVL